MDLCKQFCSKEHVSSKKLAALFIKYYLGNPEEAVGSFVELLFHAGGWRGYKYSPKKFPPVEAFKAVRDCGPVDLFPLILDRDENFQFEFQSFVTALIESEKCMLLYQEEFMSKVIQAFNTLVSSNWDSFRLVALILEFFICLHGLLYCGLTMLSYCCIRVLEFFACKPHYAIFMQGMRLLLSLDKEYESLRVESQMSEEAQKPGGSNYGSALRKKRAFLSPPWQQIFLKIYSGAQLCVYHSLCRCYRYMQTPSNDVRSICPFHEVLIWAVTLPTVPIQEDRWLPTILHGMRDKCVDNKGTALIALHQLFRQPLDCYHQRKVFNHVKSDLLYLLSTHSEVAELCLRILNSCVRYMDIELSNSDLETILHYLYDDSQAMAVLAAEFVFWSQFVPLANDPVAVIVQLVEMNRESFVHSEDLLIDSLYHMIKGYLEWGDWIKVITDAPVSDVHAFMSVLSAYIRKATTGFVPRFRRSRVIQQEMDAAEIASNSSCYSDVFPDYWFSLLELRRISDDPRAVASLLRMLQYFDAFLLSSVETVENMAQVCLAFLVITEDLNVIDQACHSLFALGQLCVDSGKEIPGLQGVIDCAVRQGVLDFQSTRGDETSSALVQRKILSITKYFEITDNSLWWFAFEQLRNACQLKIERSLKIKKTVTLIRLLFQLLMRNVNNMGARELVAERSNSASCALASSCVSRAAAFQALLRHHLHPQFDADVRRTAFLVLMDLHEFMGPSVGAQTVYNLHVCLDEGDVSALVNYAAEMMDVNKDCPQLLFQKAILSDCCSIVHKTCSFIARGLLDVHCFTPFLRCIGKCSNHDEIVMDAVNKYAANFHNKWDVLAVAILNAYVGILEKAMPSILLMEDTPHRYKFSHLYMSLLNLTQYLSGRAKFENKNIMRFLSIKLHMHMIDLALKPDGPRVVLELLYAVREILPNEDVGIVLSFLQQYKPDNGADVSKYFNFLKTSIFRYDSAANVATTTAGIIFPVMY